MRKSILRTMIISGMILGSGLGAMHIKADTDVYRLYNPNTGEHFYTSNLTEKKGLQYQGWYYEGIGWVASSKGEQVYRLYNPNAKGGDHYYTKSAYEKKSLMQQGWHYDGTFFNSAGNTPLYVAYNANAQSGAHNYTTSNFEQKALLGLGWQYGMIAWNAQSKGFADGMNVGEILGKNYSSIIGAWKNSQNQMLVITKDSITLDGKLLQTSLIQKSTVRGIVEMNATTQGNMSNFGLNFIPKGISIQNMDKSDVTKDRIVIGQDLTASTVFYKS